MMTLIAPQTGDILATSAPGIGAVPPQIHESTLVKVTATRNYNRYGGPGETVELFDLESRALESLVETPAPIVDSPRPMPTLDQAAGVLYLPLEDNRIIGIDVGDGRTLLDAQIELFSEEEEGA